MTEFVCLRDAYLKELETVVKEVREGCFILLEKTVFYAQGGGQPFDVGSIFRGSEEFKVVSVRKGEGGAMHQVERPGLNPGDPVRCVVDWKRRYRLMRMHTASHLLAALLNKELGVKITGNQLDVEKSRIDFNLDVFDRKQIEGFFVRANIVVERDALVKVYALPKREALKIPDVIKLAGAFPPEVEELRIVEIEGVDIQADGGTHVKNLREVGKLIFLSAENKGKSNRRIYFNLDP